MGAMRMRLAHAQEECETRGCTIIYATHIFDGLEFWPTHLAYLARGQMLTLRKVRAAQAAQVARDWRLPCHAHGAACCAAARHATQQHGADTTAAARHACTCRLRRCRSWRRGGCWIWCTGC